MENNALRMAARMAIEKAGCSVENYDGDSMTVALKRVSDPVAWKGRRSTLIEVMAAAKKFGGKVEDYLWYFPLGSDRAPDEFRHWCDPYTPENGFDQPGFWFYAKVTFGNEFKAA